MPESGVCDNVRMGFEQILSAGIRESLQEQRLNAVFPESVDNRFMCEDLITNTIADTKKHQQKREEDTPEFGMQLHSTATPQGVFASQHL
jgi:hypothetical protein